MISGNTRRATPATNVDAVSNGSPNTQASRSHRTRQRILAAAHDIFVREGLSGAKIEHIAQAAQTNKRLVYHHFGTKDELFSVVLEDAYAAMREAERELGLDNLPPLDAVSTLVSFIWRYYNEHDDFISLVSTENLCRAEHVKKSARLSQLNSSLHGIMAGIVRRGEADKTIRHGIDPVQLWISISSLCWFSVANRFTIAATFDPTLQSPLSGDVRLAHILSVVGAFVQNGHENSAASGEPR